MKIFGNILSSSCHFNQTIFEKPHYLFVWKFFQWGSSKGVKEKKNIDFSLWGNCATTLIDRDTIIKLHYFQGFGKPCYLSSFFDYCEAVADESEYSQVLATKLGKILSWIWACHCFLNSFQWALSSGLRIISEAFGVGPPHQKLIKCDFT